MDTKEYIVTSHDPKVWFTEDGLGGLYHELTSLGSTCSTVPYRAVEVLNHRPYNKYCYHLSLTDSEAKTLLEDPRIKAVDRKTSDRPELILSHSELRPSRVYDKSSTTINNQMKNWCLARCNSINDLFGSSASWVGELGYNLDGSGVDIVVVDTGIAQGHPEFARNDNGSGGTRVIDFNWQSLGVPGTPSGASIGGYLGDSDGHGSNCASIAAGNTCGWATKANLYSIRIFSGTDIVTGSTLGAIDTDLVFDLVTAFHLDKKTRGITRPTICTNSWGYSTSYLYMSDTYFRGQLYNNTTPVVSLGQVYSNHPSRVDSIDASVQSCAEAGVIITAAAGNNRHKCDVPGGLDWDDTYYNGYYGLTVNYLRGGTPGSATGSICVGAVDNTVSQKVYFSNTGPRVDVFTPGVMIMGAYKNASYVLPAVSDPRNSSYYLNKISGTSQATPSVAGMLACVAQARPNMTPAEALAFVQNYSIKDILVNSTGGFSNYNSLQDGYNRFMYLPFNSSVRGSWEAQ